MNKDNIQDIFAELREKNYITTSELKNLSFTYNDINDFINKGYLSRVVKGYYKTNVTGKDFNIKNSKLKKAKEALKNNELDKALNIMERYPLLNVSAKAHYILFKIYFLKQEYKKSREELLKSMELSKSNNDMKELNILMMNQIIEDKEMIKKLKK